MPVERVDYSNDDDYHQALAQEEQEDNRQYEEHQAAEDKGRYEAELNAQAQAEAQQDDIPF